MGGVRGWGGCWRRRMGDGEVSKSQNYMLVHPQRCVIKPKGDVKKPLVADILLLFGFVDLIIFFIFSQ